MAEVGLGPNSYGEPHAGLKVGLRGRSALGMSYTALMRRLYQERQLYPRSRTLLKFDFWGCWLEPRRIVYLVLRSGTQYDKSVHALR